jgi:adenylosuccinate lyase
MKAFEEGRHLRACLEERADVMAHLSPEDLDRLFDYERYTGAAPELARGAAAALTR